MKAALHERLVEELRLFVETFAAKDPKGRLLTLLETSRGCQKIFAGLDHVNWLDSELVVRVPNHLQTADEIQKMLLERGSPVRCRVISTDAELNDRDLELGTVLPAIVGGGHGTILLCLPGRLAYYESEEPQERYICFRRPGRTS
jgi:hypothetical protein